MSVVEYVRPGICLHCGAGERIVWPPLVIVDAAQRWNETHGRPPRAREWQNGTADHPAQTTVARVFGTWNRMLAAAGLETRAFHKHAAYWTKELVADAMLDWLLSNGRWPAEADWKIGRNGAHRPSADTVRRLFGSWVAAKRYAGWTEDVVPAGARGCRGCGGALDNYTDDCRICASRKWNRAKRASRKSETVAAPHLVEPASLGSEEDALGEASRAATPCASHNSGEADAPAAQRRRAA